MIKHVAKVNGKPISENELHSTMQVYALQLHQKNLDQLDAEALREIEEMSLEKLIARELIFQAALASGVVASEEQIENEKNKLIADFPSESEFFATLERAGMTPEFYHRMVRQDLTVNLMTAARLKDLPAPDQGKIEAVFHKYPERMIEPERVRARHILIRCDESERDSALQRIGALRKEATPANFSHLAELHSDCPSAQAGGDLGLFSRGQMVEPFEAAAFSQPLGEVGEVVETSYGYHLVLVEEKHPQRALRLEEASERISNFLKEEEAVRHLKQWVGELRAQAQVEICDSP